MLYFATFDTMLKNCWLFRLYRINMLYIYVLYTSAFCNIVSAPGSFSPPPAPLSKCTWLHSCYLLHYYSWMLLSIVLASHYLLHYYSWVLLSIVLVLHYLLNCYIILLSPEDLSTSSSLNVYFSAFKSKSLCLSLLVPILDTRRQEPCIYLRYGLPFLQK